MCLEELLESSTADIEREREEIKDTALIFFAGSWAVSNTAAG